MRITWIANFLLNQLKNLSRILYDFRLYLKAIQIEEVKTCFSAQMGYITLMVNE